MADMVTAEALRKKRKHPEAAVVCYINSSAGVKAESDICCTSSNALKIVRSVKQKEIIFVPDCNLGSYVAQQVPEKKIILWKGFCVTHHRVGPEEVKKVRGIHPDALLLVHPECRPEVTALADFIGSTRQIIDYASSSKASKFIIGTEMGILHKLKRTTLETVFPAVTGFDVPQYEETTLKSVYEALRDMKHDIVMDEELINKAATT